MGEREREGGRAGEREGGRAADQMFDLSLSLSTRIQLSSC